LFSDHLCRLLSLTPALLSLLRGSYDSPKDMVLFDCWYDKSSRSLLDFNRDKVCAPSAPLSCTSIVTRRAKPETPYSRALKSRQWSREKLASKRLASARV
jgi:hypothetical protein